MYVLGSQMSESHRNLGQGAVSSPEPSLQALLFIFEISLD